MSSNYVVCINWKKESFFSSDVGVVYSSNYMFRGLCLCFPYQWQIAERKAEEEFLVQKENTLFMST